MISNKESLLIHLLVIFLPAILITPDFQYFFVYGQQKEKSLEDSELSNVREEPSTRDSNLKIEVIGRGLDFPTSMAFLGPDDILVSKKIKGLLVGFWKGEY